MLYSSWGEGDEEFEPTDVMGELSKHYGFPSEVSQIPTYFGSAGDNLGHGAWHTLVETMQ